MAHVTEIDNEFLLLEHDYEINRIYLIIKGIWNDDETDINVFNNIMANMMESAISSGEFTVMADFTEYGSSSHPRFNALMTRIGQRAGEMGILGHVQLMTQAYFTDTEQTAPVIVGEDPETKMPKRYDLVANYTTAEAWLDTL